MKIKLCGLPNLEVAQNIIDTHPDAIGIYCWEEPEKGKNMTSFEEAREIAELAARRSVESFYLTYALTAEQAAIECNKVGNTHIQILGDMPSNEISLLKILLPELVIIKVVGIVDPESANEAAIYSNNPDLDQLLLDSRSGAIRGGTGKTHDWNISRSIVEKTNKPVWLAGGIKLENIEAAAMQVRPHGIDLETGIQNKDGSKNYELARQLVNLVHSV